MSQLIESPDRIGHSTNNTQMIKMTASLSMGIKLIGLALLLTFSMISTPSFAEDSVKKHGQLKKQISTASNKLASSRAVSKSLKNNVLAAEEKLNQASRQLYSTNRKIKRLSKKLERSNKQKSKLQQQTEEEKSALAKQMVALYTAGKQSYLRLLLKQDDPSSMSRRAKYYNYLNNYRLKRIQDFAARLDKIEQLQEEITRDRAKLTVLRKEQSSRKVSLRAAVKEKERSYKKQTKVVLTQKQALARLKKAESRLKGIIQRLADKQKREEKERKAKKKKAKALALARKKREKARSKEGKISQAKKVVTNKREDIVERHYVPNKKFSSLKGKLSWPVSGRITHKYGSVRNVREKWKAVVISAKGGSSVHAVARGKVEYAGRLKGYGYLVIIRHDSTYRSVYGYNRSIYKKEGDVVKAGEVIASVGNSGGIKDTGLYFEIRKGSNHQNPTKWIKK